MATPRARFASCPRFARPFRFLSRPAVRRVLRTSNQEETDDAANPKKDVLNGFVKESPTLTSSEQWTQWLDTQRHSTTHRGNRPAQPPNAPDATRIAGYRTLAGDGTP